MEDMGALEVVVVVVLEVDSSKDFPVVEELVDKTHTHFTKISNPDTVHDNQTHLHNNEIVRIAILAFVKGGQKRGEKIREGCDSNEGSPCIS